MRLRTIGMVVWVALLALLPACPPEEPTSVYGTWNYDQCDGTPVATVVFDSNGSMTYESAAGSGTGFWTGQFSSFHFSATIDSSPMATLMFDGTLLSYVRIEGTTTSDQPPTVRCVVMSR